MTRRPLDEEETNITKKNMQRHRESIDYNEYIVRHADLMINEGLKLNYMRQLGEYKHKKRAANEEIQELRKIISISEQQLRDGVEIKEKQPEKEDA